MSDIRAAATAEHNKRVDGLSAAEKAAYNDGYLYASGDAIEMISSILEDDEKSAAEKIEAIEVSLIQASVPLVIAGMATGKDYLP